MSSIAAALCFVAFLEESTINSKELLLTVEERIRYLEEIGAPLAVDGSGAVTAAAMAGLRAREAAAAARRDWRLA